MYVSPYQAVKLYKERERQTEAYCAQRALVLAATRKESSERRDSVMRRMMRWLHIDKGQPRGVNDAQLAHAI
jgi:hypothetical protein